MNKACPNCNRIAKEDSQECPYCGIIFSKWKPRQPGPPSKRASQSTKPKRRRSIVPLLIIGVVIVGLIAGGFFIFRSGGKRTVKLMAQRIAGKKWKSPSGSPEEISKTMTVEQLIQAWKTLPDKKSLTAQHATYAKALGLKGREASQAVPALAPFVTEKDVYLRQAAMEGLAGIGAEGLPHLITALKYGEMEDGNAVHVRWDAAIAISKMGPSAGEAIPALLETLTNPKENFNVKLDAAVALAQIGNDAVPAMNKARCYFYNQGGLSPAEVKVLRELNLALQRMNAVTERCQQGESQETFSRFRENVYKPIPVWPNGCSRSIGGPEEGSFPYAGNSR